MKNFICILFLLFSINSFSQSTKGTEFWCGFMENIDLPANNCPLFSFIIFSEYNTKGTIFINQLDTTIYFNISSNIPMEIFLPYSKFCNINTLNNDTIYYPIGSGKISKTSIKITSDLKISVYAMHYREYFSEATILIPSKESGTEYYSFCAKERNVNYESSQFLILSEEDQNNLEIIPSELIPNHPKGIPYNIILNKGETYQEQSIDDLTASYIYSTNKKKFTLFSGAKTGVSILNNNAIANNHLWDENYSTDRWGNLFLIVPFKIQAPKTIKGDLIKIIACQDSTIINFSCQKSILLNKAQIFDSMFAEPTLIISNNPICVAQYMKQGDLNINKLGDPNLLIISSFDKQLKIAGFISSNQKFYYSGNFYNHFIHHYLNIISFTDKISSILLDDVNISNKFQSFPTNPNYSFAQIEVSFGSHLLKSPEGCQAYAYGTGGYDAYTFHLGYDFKDSTSLGGGFSLPDTIANVGDKNFHIPIYINRASSTPVVINNFNIKLHFESSMFLPDSAQNGKIKTEYKIDQCYVTITLPEINLIQSMQVLTDLIGTVALGNYNRTPIIIDSVWWDGNSDLLSGICGEEININGSLTIQACELDLRRVKLYNPTKMNIATDVGANGRSPLWVGIETEEKGLFSLSIINILGETIYQESWQNDGTNKIKAIDMNNFSSGNYFVILRTEGGAVSKRLIKN